MTTDPNRSRRAHPAANPAPDQVRGLRERIQAEHGLGITVAQDRCASAIHVTRRAWQQYEHGDRRLHPAFWALACIRLAGADPHQID